MENKIVAQPEPFKGELFRITRSTTGKLITLFLRDKTKEKEQQVAQFQIAEFQSPKVFQTLDFQFEKLGIDRIAIQQDKLLGEMVCLDASSTDFKEWESIEILPETEKILNRISTVEGFVCTTDEEFVSEDGRSFKNKRYFGMDEGDAKGNAEYWLQVSSGAFRLSPANLS